MEVVVLDMSGADEDVMRVVLEDLPRCFSRSWVHRVDADTSFW